VPAETRADPQPPTADVARLECLDFFRCWLLSGFGVVIGGSCDQGSDEGAEQSLSPPPGVVDELKEAKVGGQLLL
jgi:hypothetical protein